jgi:hypothetical protein
VSVIVHTIIPICALCLIQYCIRYFEQFSSRKCGSRIFSFTEPGQKCGSEHNLVLNSLLNSTDLSSNWNEF